MRELSLILIFLVTLFTRSSESPHGDSLTISCDECHNSEGWEVNRNEIEFNHSKTDFQLTGLHTEVSCKACHPTLVFNEADPECMSCHVDMHQQTVGFECGRCHTTNSWIVTDITDIHQRGRFPLLGAHITADCYDCHASASLLKFEPLGIECVDCHLKDYQATTDPNHAESGFSTECADCHQINAFSWQGSSFTHAFFPLTLGHQINNCNQCHKDGDFSGLSPDCFSCHEQDYLATNSPNHQQLMLSTECTQCHTTNPGWKPADFSEHDNIFPIYSGEHNGEWSSCTDCHPNPANYSQFTCIDCHEHNQGDMDEEHQGIGGYLYNSAACLECHPTGSEEGSFNHNLSIFPLTGAHITTECADCHTSGYEGTPTICSDCHIENFNQTTNPNHIEIELGLDCETCHTTEPGWIPALFDIHNDYYALTGAHATVDCFSCHEDQYSNTSILCFDCHTTEYNQSSNPSHLQLDLSTLCESCHTTSPGWQPATFDVHNQYYQLNGAHISLDCNSCHESQYTGTPNTCIGCHLDDYNQTINPPHASAQFSTECLSCHTEMAWEPSTFDHDSQYFPIYSGKHNGEWNQCDECHTTPGNYTLFSCIDCHEHNQADMDEEHQGVNNYIFNSVACLDCHPDGSEKHMNIIQRNNIR